MKTKEIEKQENTEEMVKTDKVRVWLNFDFEFRGDYEGMYTFLDRKKAVECGSEAAYFEMQPSENNVEQLRKELLDNVKLSKTDRIHIVISHKGRLQVGFLFGGRKRAVWTGYAIDEKPGIIDIL
jgi:hypothetical protein